MKVLDWPLWADEDVSTEVIDALLRQGRDVRSVRVEHPGISDIQVLTMAHGDGRVVLTHDLDYGTLAFRDRSAFTGIVCVRPGHLTTSFVLETLAVIEQIEVEAPFIIVAERRTGGKVHVRVRRRSTR